MKIIYIRLHLYRYFKAENMPQFWKQFINNPKSVSSDSITVPSRKDSDSTSANISTSIPSVKKLSIIAATATTTTTLATATADLNPNKTTSSASPPRIRPILSTRPNSFHTSSNHNVKTNIYNNTNKLSSQIVITQSDDYKMYRDTFLNNKHGFNGHVFGVSLCDSLSAASAEVIVQSELVSFGRIPIVVAKCGAFLKSNGLETSGIFRIAGNSKRVKELQYIFSHGPDYGSKFNNWDGYSVHDVASLLRRFLNNLQEPLIPLSLYEEFRNPLRNRPRILKHMALHNVSHPNADKTNSLPLNSLKDKTSNNKSNTNSNTNSNNSSKDTSNNTDTKENVHTESACNKISNSTKGQENPVTPSETTNDNNIPETNINKENVSDELVDTNKQSTQNNDTQEKQKTTTENDVTVLKENINKKTKEEKKEENEGEVDGEELQRKKELRHRKRLSRDIRSALKDYETLFIHLNNDTKQLTIYLLDLLSLFARQSQFNLMSARNLAAIFQPSFLSHPQHDMDPKEYELSRFVVEFLIEYSYKLLPRLLKIAKKEQQERSNNHIDSQGNNNTASPTTIKPFLKQHSSPLKNNIKPPRVTINDSETNKSSDAVKSKQLSVKRSSSSLKPPTVPSPSQLRPQSSKNIIRRPHSRSIGSVPTPPDVIVSNRRRTTLFPWLHKPGFLSDAGDSTTTEIEDADDDFDDDNNSPTMNASTNKNILTVPPINRTLSGNSTSSSSFRINNFSGNSNRPLSMVLSNVFNKSSDELLEYSSSNEGDNTGSATKTRRRESWFQRFTR